MGEHDADPDQAIVRERPEGRAAGVQEPLALVPLMGDRVLAVTLARPGRCAEVAVDLSERRPFLEVERVDLLRAVDLAEASELGPVELPMLDRLRRLPLLPHLDKDPR